MGQDQEHHEWIRNLCDQHYRMVDDTDHCTRFITVFNSLEAGVFRKFTSIADTPEKLNNRPLGEVATVGVIIWLH